MSVIEQENIPLESSGQKDEEEKKLQSSEPKAASASSSEELPVFGTPPTSPSKEMAAEEEPVMSTQTTITVGQEMIETELVMEIVEASGKEEQPVEEKKEPVEEMAELDAQQDEDAEGEEEETPSPGLFEQPLIVEGKRHRTTTQMLQYQSPAVNTPKYKGGSGAELGNEPHFLEVVAKKSTEELKPLHKILYGHTGKHAVLKKELRRFSGFNFDEKSQDFAKRHKMLTSLKSKELALVQSAFRKFYWPEDKKDKDNYATELLKVLLSPPDKTAATKKPKASSQTPTRGRKRATSGSQEPKKKRMRRSKKVVESEDEAEDVFEHEEEEEEPMEVEVKDDKKPTSSELTELIEAIIKVADFNTLNTRGIIEQISVKYPEMDVEKRRLEIKKIVKQVILAHAPPITTERKPE